MVLTSFLEKRVPTSSNLEDDNQAKAELLSVKKTGISSPDETDKFLMNLRWKVELADAVAVMEGAEENRRLPDTVHAEECAQPLKQNRKG